MLDFKSYVYKYYHVDELLYIGSTMDKPFHKKLIQLTFMSIRISFAIEFLINFYFINNKINA